MAFLDKVSPVKIQLIGSRHTPEEKCRARMIALIRKQSTPRKVKRSWFLAEGDKEFFAPRYANVNIIQKMTSGRKNAFPVYKTKKTTLRLFSKDVEQGKLDAIMLKIAQERSKQLTGRRRKRSSARKKGA